MSELAGWTMGTAVVSGVGALGFLLVPEKMRTGLERFPRHRVLGWVLSAAAYGVAGVALWHAPPEWMAGWKDLVWVLAPVAWVLTGLLLDELLAARALGGLLLLVASPVLDAARFHPSSTRLVMVVLAYGAVGLGLWWVASPWGFRQTMRPVVETPTRLRLMGGVLLVLSLVLMILGAAVY